jgi:hypothetical protein
MWVHDIDSAEYTRRLEVLAATGQALDEGQRR